MAWKLMKKKTTKFFGINSEVNDKGPLSLRGKTIGYCKKYLYLGSWFTDDGKP